MLRTTLQAGCRDCAVSGWGGLANNPFTAFDALCRGEHCQDQGFPQVSVNLSNLTLYIRAVDLVFGGEPGFSLERSYNQDDTTSGPFGIGWAFNLGDSLTPNADGSQILRRSSGRIDRFAPSTAAGAFFALTNTTDTLSINADGTFTLRSSGSTATELFSADGRLLAIQDSGLARVSLDYDASLRVTAAHYRGRLLQFSYADATHIGAVTDSAGRTVSYSYTSDGRLAQQTNADGQTVSYQYDGAGNLASVSYSGATTMIAYNIDPPYLSVASITTPDNAVRQYDTPLTPNQIRLTDGKGNSTLYVSSAVGLLLSVTDAGGNLISYGYDATGRRTATTDGAGEVSKFSYDSAGNLTSITDGAGNKWSADYTSAGPAHITDPKGNVWTLSYDGAGNLISVADPSGGGFSAARSASGQITSLSDALGNKKTYQYGNDGLLASFVDALTGKWAYQYDGAARVSVRTDPGGAALSASYDNGVRITGLSDGATNFPFDYSGQQRDGLNRLVSYTDSFGNQITYQYDAAGQLISVTLPGNKTIAYQYDRAHRLSIVTDWTGNFAVYRYDAAGWPASVTVSGGPIVAYQYDSARRLRSLVSTGPDGQPVAGYRYTLDAAGNRTAVSSLEPSTAKFTIAANSFTFDSANHPLLRSDGQNYKYDVRGNLTSIQGPNAATFAYDAIGRLAGVNGDNAISYTYDTAGLRVVRTNNGTVRRFVYDLSGAAPRLVMEADASNTPVAWYVYGLGLLWKVVADGTPYFYHFDGDGNTVALSTPASGVVNTYRYDPRGLLVSSNEGVENSLRAHGETGWIDDGNGVLFTGRNYLLPALRLTLPSFADPSPPAPNLLPALQGAGACFLQGVANCLFATGRRER